MKNLIDNLDQAYGRKNAIIANQGAYNYVAKVPYEHKFKVSWGWFKTSWVWDSETRYRDELRFDSDRYNRDVARADQDIAACRGNIDHLISTAQASLDNMRSNTSSIESNISSIQSKLSSFSHQYNTSCTRGEDFSRELQVQENKKRLIEQAVNQEKNVLITLPNQISSAKQEIKHKEAILQQKEEQLALVEEKLTESQLKFKSQVESLTLQQRAYIFAETFGIPEKDFILKTIHEVGLDSGSLGFYAIVKNNKALLETALYYKANFGSYHYDGKSLLQHLIKAGNIDLIDFVLSLGGQDFGATLLTAIDQDDITTLSTILSHNPYLLSSLHEHGYSLLHVAVSLHKIDIIKTLLSLDETLVDIKSTDLESPFTVALRAKVPEVTKLLLPHINLKHEIETLIKRDNIELLQNLSEMNISLENSDKIMVEQVLLGQDIGELVHTFEDIDLIGQFNDYEI
jgi:hypothetical protein